MKNKIAHALVGAMVFLGAMAGATAAQAVTAEAAEAYTDKCQSYKYWQSSNHYFIFCHRDYNWWEESWMGGNHRDYTYAKHYYLT